MIPSGQFDRDLERWLEVEAPRTGPTGLHEKTIDRARFMRQRPAWVVSLRGGTIPGRVGTLGLFGARIALLLVVLGLAVALVVGAIAAGAFRSDPVKHLVDQNAVVPTSPAPAPTATSSAPPTPSQTLNPASLPAAVIPAGLHPTMTPQAAAQQVLDAIARGEYTLGYAIVPARIIAIRLMPPGSTFTTLDGSPYTADTLSWAVTAEGTFADCAGSGCGVSTRETTFIPDDGVSGGGIVGNGGVSYSLPDRTFLGELDMQGQLFGPGPIPTAGVISAAAVLAVTRGSGLTTNLSSLRPNLRQTYGPIYGLVSCIDPTKGCGAIGTEVGGQTVAIWWVRFPTDHGLVWIAVDATTGATLEMSSPSGS